MLRIWNYEQTPNMDKQHWRKEKGLSLAHSIGMGENLPMMRDQPEKENPGSILMAKKEIVGMGVKRKTGWWDDKSQYSASLK